jgi:hypothetical protein
MLDLASAVSKEGTSRYMLVATEDEAINRIIEDLNSGAAPMSFTVMVPQKFMGLYDKLACLKDVDVLFLNYEEDQTLQLRCNHKISRIYVICCLGESAACNSYGNLSVAMEVMSEVGGTVAMYQVKHSAFSTAGAGDAKAVDMKSVGTNYTALER